MSKKLNIQDSLLNYVRKNKVSIKVYLLNNTIIEGYLKGFDNFVIIIKDKDQKLIYKHAIAYIIPSEEFDDVVIG
ncbi:MAG: RNA chaperone Hfq [Deferribacterota bacterium]|nr:RNA chaperone Hfq [Deferribacterota bacterium]